MSHDGTSHSDGETTPNSARTIVDLYFRNVNTTGTTRDIWQVGDALLNRTEEVDDRVEVVEEDLSDFEDETEKEFKTVEQRITELEEIVALLIFNLEDVGIPINFEALIDYKDENLNI